MVEPKDTECMDTDVPDVGFVGHGWVSVLPGTKVTSEKQEPMVYYLVRSSLCGVESLV